MGKTLEDYESEHRQALFHQLARRMVSRPGPPLPYQPVTSVGRIQFTNHYVCNPCPCGRGPATNRGWDDRWRCDACDTLTNGGLNG